MNFDGFNRENKKTSIKCHHPPGGSANFSLGWTNQGNKENGQAKPDQKQKSNFNVLTGEGTPYAYQNVVVKSEDKENENNANCVNINQVNEASNFLEFNDNSKKTSIKTDYSMGKNNLNIFNNDISLNAKNSNSSIKVACTPGGKSSVFFGDDRTSYEEYRKKR